MLEKAKWQQSCNREKKNPAAKIATHPKRANKSETKKLRIVEPEKRATKSTKVDKQEMLRNTHQRKRLPPICQDTWGEKWTKVNIKKKSHQKAQKLSFGAKNQVLATKAISKRKICRT